jgi:hypothetical protein
MPADHSLPPLFHITEQLGAVQIDGDSATGRVQFRLFFPAGFDPQIQQIRAAGSFQGQLGGTDWDFPGGPLLARSNRPEGEFWTLTLEPPLTSISISSPSRTGPSAKSPIPMRGTAGATTRIRVS